MKNIFSCLALSTALLIPGLAAARPVTLTTTLKKYGGDGAYLAVYLTDASGAFVRTIWVAGEKSKYYKHLTEWYRATGGKSSAINGITGASVGAGRELKITVDLADALFDAGYKINIDAAAEDLRDSPRDISIPLTKAGAGQPNVGRRFVAGFTYTP
ncbi:DUF2271 domain-containing protein [Zwartia vadi]|uniref:DUF2271 domain-containing protein n=1 Tax=Zwartia vadi TaxID=3058168 RepID=UPI0025B40424|nr:DUF2271 domain-containing protein [Zwartia vadi]MDN3986570.1 DUF2271 domain-containing protein [Zwartia vadi]